MNKEGLPLARVIAALQQARDQDFTYQDSEILGSMCTAPDAAAQEAVRIFLETNLGDPAHFPGTQRLEQEVQQELIKLTNGESGGKDPAHAVMTSGGTESNLLAVQAAREAWRERTGKKGQANVVVPDSAHFSFEKARRLTDTKLVRVATDEDHRAQVDAMKEAVTEDTCLIVAVAGTTETGTLDPVSKLAQAASKMGVPLHVDAALGGFLLPFLPADGPRTEPWDFLAPGVTTITLDPHKMGTVPVPAGALLARNRSHLQRIAVETPYVTSDHQIGLLGTRPGFAAAACWAVLQHQGQSGFQRIAERCMQNSAYVRQWLEKEHLAFEGHDLNVVLVKTSDPLKVQAALSTKGWRVNAVERLSGVRLVMMPHVNREQLDRFLPQLKESVNEHPYPAPAGSRPRSMSQEAP